MKLPALMDAVMPPCVSESGCPKYSRYWSLPIQADMLETSKPNKAPPIVPLERGQQILEAHKELGCARGRWFVWGVGWVGGGW